jgi:hypothetical protein
MSIKALTYRLHEHTSSDRIERQEFTYVKEFESPGKLLLPFLDVVGITLLLERSRPSPFPRLLLRKHCNVC